MQDNEKLFIYTFNELQKLLAITKIEQRMKHLLINITDVEELRDTLREFIYNSPYDYTKLAKELSTRFPTGGWTYRVLDHLLNSSVDIGSIRLNQICDVLFPVKQINEVSVDYLYERVDEIHEQVTKLRSLLKESVKGDRVIDTDEYNLLKSLEPIITNKFKQFLDITNTIVNKPLQIC